MLWLQRLGAGLVVLLLLLLGVGLVLPREISLERRVTIAAAPAEVFPHLNDLARFNRWSPWSQRDPDMTLRFEGPEAGVGQRMIWSSFNPQVGSGSQEIIESRPDALVRTLLDFGAQGQAFAEWRLEPVAGGTELVWGFSTDLGFNPVGRYFGFMVKDMVGADYEAGLSALKTLVEGEVAG